MTMEMYVAERSFGDSHNSDSVIVKDCWHIFGGKFVGGVGDQETGFADSTVPHHHTPVESKSQLNPENQKI